jgi:hypothetical protein
LIAQVYLIGGSIPEENLSKYYNTCLVFGRRGELLAKHRLGEEGERGQKVRESEEREH